VTEEAIWSLLVVTLLALLVPIVILSLTARLGPRPERGRSDTEDKLSVYECGITPKVGARRRFSAKFYLVAVLFVLFDVEVAFLIPWAVTFRELGQSDQMGWGILLAMAAFIEVLVVGLIYLIKRGALEWE